MDLKPRFHYLPEKNWMNDPNGLIYYEGLYHLFYQYNPFDATWGHIHWGHAVSDDLIHWREQAIAMKPSVELGEIHCFSGCTLIHEGQPMAFYTSVGEGERNCLTGAEQWIAKSYDGMQTWEKIDENPFLTKEIHGDLEILDWRDPFIWKEQDVFYMVLGGKHNEKGCIVKYQSLDLMNWSFEGIIYESDEFNLIECPNLVRFGEKTLIVYSPMQDIQYMIGTFDSEGKFVPETKGKFDGSSFKDLYATYITKDAQGDTVFMAWLREETRGEWETPFEWSGAQSLPRTIWLDEHHQLRMKPFEGVKSLRGEVIEYQKLIVEDTPIQLEAPSNEYEIVIETALRGDEIIAVDVLASCDAREKTTIIYDAKANQIKLVRSVSSLNPTTLKEDLVHQFNDKGADMTKYLTLRIFVDHSVVEVFANDALALAGRIYPTLEESQQVYIKKESDGTCCLDQISIYQMKS